MGGNVERHIGDDDRDGAAIGALQPGGMMVRLGIYEKFKEALAAMEKPQ